MTPAPPPDAEPRLGPAAPAGTSRAEARSTRRVACPKHMAFGPCGGVGADETCEVDRRRCPFVDEPADFSSAGLLGPMPGASRPTSGTERVVATRRSLPRVLVDVRLGRGHADAGWDRLTPRGAWGLLGEHLDDPDDTTPQHNARAAREAGIEALVTLSGRERDRRRTEDDIDELLSIGVAGIHCVTGDHPAARDLPQTTAFRSESVTLVARVATRSPVTVVSVAESPASPPAGIRAPRLRAKQDAGATVAILNHSGSIADLGAFAHSASAAGVTIPIVAPVPVVTDASSAEALAAFPGVHLPPGMMRRIAAADDPRRAGIAEATAMSIDLLLDGRLDAVNLSGSASGRSARDRVDVVCEILDGIAEALGGHPAHPEPGLPG